MSRPGKLVLQTVSRLFVVGGVFLSSAVHETRRICLKLARRIFIFLFISSIFHRKCAQSKYMFFSCRDAPINAKPRLLFCSLKNAATHFKKCKNASSSCLDFIGVLTFLSVFSSIYSFPLRHDLKLSAFSLKYIFFLDLPNGRYFYLIIKKNNPQMRTENKNTHKV